MSRGPDSVPVAAPVAELLTSDLRVWSIEEVVQPGQFAFVDGEVGKRAYHKPTFGEMEGHRQRDILLDFMVGAVALRPEGNQGWNMADLTASLSLQLVLEEGKARNG